MSVTLEVLRAKSKVLEDELNDIKAAIRVMESFNVAGLAQDSAKSDVDIIKTPKIGDTGIININELDIPKKEEKPKRATLFTEIEALVSRFSDQEFTVKHVIAALKGMGKSSNAKQFNNRVAMNVKKLVDNGVIDRTYNGTGNTPHRYKLTQKDTQPRNTTLSPVKN